LTPRDLFSGHAPAARLRPSLPAHQSAATAERRCLAARDKHDGFRVVARKDGERVRLYSRPGNDLTYRFPLIVEALARLPSRSCIIDGEAVCCDEDGMPSFHSIRYRRHDASVFLYAFDLIELSGDDLRRSHSRFARPRWRACCTGLASRFSPCIIG
jgi:ATP-dependent DNA ligase